MICKNCNSELPDNAAFCPNCGAKTEPQTPGFCSKCGAEIKENEKFCPKCGNNLLSASVQNTPTDAAPSNSDFKGTYWISSICATICLLVRLAMQENHIYWDNIVDNLDVLGIDRKLKPLLSAIPAVAAIIVILMIVNNKMADKQSRTKAIIINIIIIAISILFIWFDIPYSIIDF